MVSCPIFINMKEIHVRNDKKSYLFLLIHGRIDMVNCNFMRSTPKGLDGASVLSVVF